MRQQSKFIDITRSFLPLDPNSFPQSMHASAPGDSAPEQRIPVSLIEGRNFLPTAYGYKSFFGLNGYLSGTPLPSEPDIMFMYQSVSLRNVIVALCRTGIYVKEANDDSAWVAKITLPGSVTSDDDSFYPWTYCLLDNKIYCYIQSSTVFWEISSTSVNNCVVTARTPTFLNMEGQVGIFRAGGRLGFWDTDNSVAWSSIDDFEEFTPSVETLAGSAKFTDVVGTIINVLPHGPGFIIYSTGSVIYIQKKVESLFQWDPVVIFNTNGIAYRKQAVASMPDTTHFAYTTKGIYAISGGQAQPLAPEVFDYFEQTNSTKFLALLQGRYLCFENMTEEGGNALYFDQTVDDTIITLPGGATQTPVDPDDVPNGGPAAGSIDQTVEEGGDNTPEGTGPICSTMVKNNGSFADQTPESFGLANPEDWKSSTYYRAKWNAYLSMPRATDGSDIIWEATPCGLNWYGEILAMSPRVLSLRLVTGDDAYVDGNWTIERFVAIQTALWNIDNANLAAFKAAVVNRSYTRTTSFYSNTVPSLNPDVNVDCPSLTVPGEFLPDYHFGMSRCAYWLTRYSTSPETVHTISTIRESSRDTNRPIPNQKWWFKGAPYIGPADSPESLVATWNANYAASNPSVGTIYLAEELFPESFGISSWIGYPNAVYFANKWVFRKTSDGTIPVSGSTEFGGVYGEQLTAGYVPGISPISPLTQVYEFDARGRWEKTVSLTAYNTLRADPATAGTLYAIDTAYVELAGWEYIKADNTIGFLPKGDSCSQFADALNYNPRTGVELPAATPTGVSTAPDGSVCGVEFEPITLPPVDALDPGDPNYGQPGYPEDQDWPSYEVIWPEVEVVIPGGDFILRDGTSEPSYPEKYGAYVYDLHLKKWGKFSDNYRLLLDYSDLINDADGIIPASTFGILGGAVSMTGLVYLFDSYPASSYVKYGKIGYYRSGVTALEELKVDFREPAKGYLQIETSLDGRTIYGSATVITSYDGAMSATHYGSMPGKWHFVSVYGWYDLSYVEYKGFRSGNR